MSPVSPKGSKTGQEVCSPESEPKRLMTSLRPFRSDALGRSRKTQLRRWTRKMEDFSVGISPDVFPMKPRYDSWFERIVNAGRQNQSPDPIQKCSHIGVGFPSVTASRSRLRLRGSHWSATCWLREIRREQILFLASLTRVAHHAKALSAGCPAEIVQPTPTAGEIARPRTPL